MKKTKFATLYLKVPKKKKKKKYIYIYRVGSITWPQFGHFKVNNLANSRSTTWPPFFEPTKVGFFEFFWCAIFRGRCKISVLKSCFGQKKGFPKKKKVAHFFWGVEGLVGCCCVMLLDALEGCSKTYKKGFLNTLLLDAEETEKQEATEKGPKKVTPIFWGALKTGRK